MSAADDALESQHLLAKSGGAQMTSKIKLNNLCCDMELRLVSKALDGMPGIINYKVNLLGRMVEVRYEPDNAPVGQIVKALNELNLGANVKEAGTQGEQLSPEETCRRDVLGMAGLYTLISETILLLWYFSSGRVAQTPLWLAIFIGGSSLAKNVISRALAGVISPDMQTLMFIAVAGASALGNLIEAVTMLWLIAVSHIAEHSVLALARAKVDGCGDSLPMTATLKSTGADIPITELKPGDQIIVRAGEGIPADGVVIENSAHVDESSVTGESLPKKKVPHKGSSKTPAREATVMSGTLVLDGLLIIQVTAVQEGTASIIQDMVESAASSKTPTHTAIDTFAGHYTTVILSLAVAIMVWPVLTGAAVINWADNFHRSLVLVVLGCPCALVTAGPIVTTCGVAANASKGVLVKTADALEALAGLRTICFDKTGTLTDGHFRVVDQWTAADASEQSKKAVIALESMSTHPIAAAVVNSYAGCMTEAVEAMGAKLNLPEVTDFKVIDGVGIRGVCGGLEVTVGSKRILQARNSQSLKVFMDKNDEATMVFGMVGDEVVAGYALFDSPRPIVGEMLKQLRELNVESELLSGDRGRVVEVVARKLGIDRARGDLIPTDKVEAVQNLQMRENAVAMVGDGINDAPALTAANVGWAMGAGGTAMAAKSASVVGVNDDLLCIPATIRHARACKSIVKQNIIISILPKVSLAAVSLLGMYSPPLWLAVSADSGCLLIVLLNGMRVFWI